MVDGELVVEDFLEVLADVAQAQVQALQGLELGCDAGGESADGDVADVAEEVLDADFLRFLGLDGGRGVDEGAGRCCAILCSQLYPLYNHHREHTSLISSTAK